jgi:hypothetical protein
MTLSLSARLGIQRWSAGTDTFTRQQMDDAHRLLDSLTAIDVQGTMAARPAASIRGRYYWVSDPADTTNDLTLWRDDGSTWRLVNRKAVVTPFERTFTVSGDVLVAVGDNFYIPPFYLPIPSNGLVRFTGGVARINSGTSATYQIKVNDTVVPGLSGLPATPAENAVPLPTTTSLAAIIGGTPSRAKVAMEVTAVTGSPKNLTVSLFFDTLVV